MRLHQALYHVTTILLCVPGAFVVIQSTLVMENQSIPVALRRLNKGAVRDYRT
jgi:hypothetical protein